MLKISPSVSDDLILCSICQKDEYSIVFDTPTKVCMKCQLNNASWKPNEDGILYPCWNCLAYGFSNNSAAIDYPSRDGLCANCYFESKNKKITTGRDVAVNRIEDYIASITKTS